MTTNMYRDSFWGDENMLKLDHGEGCTTLNILKATKLYSLNGWILWCVKYVSIKRGGGGGGGNTPYKKIHQVPVSKSIHGYKTIISLIVQLLYHPSFYSLIIYSLTINYKGNNGKYNTPSFDSSIIYQIIPFCLSQWVP